MRCRHQGFHTITSSYDREARVLTSFRRCDDCGARLDEVSRVAYEPRFDPGGNDRFLTTVRPPAVRAAMSPQVSLAGGRAAPRRPTGG